jgi:hypothetical protein
VGVACQLANVKITVAYSDAIRTACTDYVTVVKADSAALTFGKTETRAGYFKAAPLYVESTLTYPNPDGTTRKRILRGTIANPAPREYYKITVNDTLGSGSVKPLTLLVNETPVQKGTGNQLRRHRALAARRPLDRPPRRPNLQDHAVWQPGVDDRKLQLPGPELLAAPVGTGGK